MQQISNKHCEKIYHDRMSTGKSIHVGYVIGPFWLDAYRVTPLKENHNV